MGEQIISVRISGALRDVFNKAMQDSGTNASEFLRDAIKKRVEGMVPGPESIDMVEEAHAILKDEKYLDTIESRDRRFGLRSFCKLAAIIMVNQDEALKKFLNLADKTANERGNFIKDHFEIEAKANLARPM